MSVSCCLQHLGRGGEGGESPDPEQEQQEQGKLTVLENNNTIGKNGKLLHGAGEKGDDRLDDDVGNDLDTSTEKWVQTAQRGHSKLN